jgi:ABC-type multidrug transport system ATPase subunit
MPASGAHFTAHHPPTPGTERHSDEESLESHVHVTREAEDEVAELYSVLSRRTTRHYPDKHQAFDDFLQQENDGLERQGICLPRLGVCFKDLTTWGGGETHAPVKTLKTAVWRTLTGQDIYEWTLGKVLSKPKPQDGRPLIRNFSGVVRSGEMMLVLGRPGSGCSTFLKTIANHHSSYLGVTGSLDYSGLDPREISSKYRGEVAYVPEDDIHFPTLSVRQTLEFALQSKTPKRCRADIPRYLEMFARVFGLSHVLETLVGNEYIRGVSGGERKRVSIIESLIANPSVAAWDNSTRGLDAASALDYARSLRIMTDTCGKATIVSLYQVSDAVFDLADKVLLIDEGRMIYQGPSNLAAGYFESLGYQRIDRQTTADFLAGITLPAERRFKKGWEHRAPKGAVELEKAFLESYLYKNIQNSIRDYEQAVSGPKSECSESATEGTHKEIFAQSVTAGKSRYVPANSSYTVSLQRQIYMCAKRQWWQLRGDPASFYLKTASTIINALLIGSMFYSQPQTSEGAFSRGGFILYSSILLGWIQLAEVEEAFNGRDIITRQKKFAFVKPSAVSLARVVFDLWDVLVQAILYCVIAYFLAGMKMEVSTLRLSFCNTVLQY